MINLLASISTRKSAPFIFVHPGTKIHQVHLNKLMYMGANRVVARTLENMQKLLEESREAYRILENRQRHVNSYRQLSLR